MTTLLRNLIATGAIAIALPAAATGQGDHPLVGRYEGAQLLAAHEAGFDEVALIAGPIPDRARQPGDPGWLVVEGTSALYYYRLPAGRSSLEVLRNYQASLAANGFSTGFSCATSDGSCYQPRPGRSANTAPFDLALAYDASPELPRLEGDFIRNYFGTNARHLHAKRSRPDGEVHVAITVAEHARGNHAFVRVVESAAMATGMIDVVTAEQLQHALDGAGRIDLYGIRFDFDRDEIRPESAATLDEIADLMRGQPALVLAVVGHTDNQGGSAYNMDLSRRRAHAVVEALRGRGIDADRLTARGAGAGDPVAGNDSDDGRARNRRVELIRQ
jgi:outer membrane protein OmpA-like peptidoglycan-associated protein